MLENEFNRKNLTPCRKILLQPTLLRELRHMKVFKTALANGRSDRIYAAPIASKQFRSKR